ncbi:MAG: protein phosphatase CheZ [Thioalkalispiraceae bacterium]|jgi:chemotaxis protein CheZ
MDENEILKDETIARVRDLLATLEKGDAAGASDVIDELANIRESEIYKEMGRITRELHDAITAFGMDEQISVLAQTEIPDARQRLRHVIDMTDQAANKTLTEVEESLPICEELEKRSSELHNDWKRFTKRDMDINEFKQLAKSLDDFFSVNTGDASKLKTSLTNVLMAQDFQDLTSQIIKKVIKLVEEVEGNLVEIIKLTGNIDKIDRGKAEKRDDKLAGPVVPGVNDDSSTVSGQDDVDELLSSLGF